MNFLQHLLASLTILVIALNLIFWLLPLFLFAAVKSLVHARLVQRACNHLLEGIYRSAVLVDSFWLTKVINIRIDTEGKMPTDPAPIVISNHQSWFDILVVQHLITGGFHGNRESSKNTLQAEAREPLVKLIFRRLAKFHKSRPWQAQAETHQADKQDLSEKATQPDAADVLNQGIQRGPVVKFLLKRELLWVPIVGWICYALNFPRLHRGQGADARQKDYAAIDSFSTSMQHERGALLIFAEGTRFTHDKALTSPYRHLLKPRPGGLKIALENAPAKTPVIDLTIIYHGSPNFWRCLAGNTRRISTFITATQKAEIADASAWLESRWQEKDNLQRWHDR